MISVNYKGVTFHYDIENNKWFSYSLLFEDGGYPSLQEAFKNVTYKFKNTGILVGLPSGTNDDITIYGNVKYYIDTADKTWISDDGFIYEVSHPKLVVEKLKHNNDILRYLKLLAKDHYAKLSKHVIRVNKLYHKEVLKYIKKLKQVSA